MSSSSNKRAARVQEKLRKLRQAAELKKQKGKEAEEKEKRERGASPELSAEVRGKLQHQVLSLTCTQQTEAKRAEASAAIDKYFDLLREKAVLDANNEALLISAAVTKEAQAANMDKADAKTVNWAVRRFSD
jgi:hypothetical protein